MPTLNFRAEAKDREGKPVAGPEGLSQIGPRLPVTLMVSDAHRQMLAERGEPAPNAINGFALVDTGASATCVDLETADEAGLPVIGKAVMHTASHAEHEVPVYSGKLSVPSFGDVELEFAMGANLDSQNLVALIGRDVLQAAVLVYNGTSGTVSISI